MNMVSFGFAGPALLSETDGYEPLFNEEDELLHAYEMLEWIEAQEMVAEGIFLEDQEDCDLSPIDWGAIMHRFPCDEAITEYCQDNYLDHPHIAQNGQVTAWCDYLGETVTIGWIS